MAEAPLPVDIPNRPFFKAAEVCELVKVQPYVLRSWENEFPELGAAKAAGGPRIYRRADVEQGPRIKHLLLVEGLTLAGARRRLEETAAGASAPAASVAAQVSAAPVPQRPGSPIAGAGVPAAIATGTHNRGTAHQEGGRDPHAAAGDQGGRQAIETRERLSEVKRGLRSILDLLSGEASDDGFVLQEPPTQVKPAPRGATAARRAVRSQGRRNTPAGRPGARKRSV